MHKNFSLFAKWIFLLLWTKYQQHKHDLFEHPNSFVNKFWKFVNCLTYLTYTLCFAINFKGFAMTICWIAYNTICWMNEKKKKYKSYILKEREFRNLFIVISILENIFVSFFEVLWRLKNWILVTLDTALTQKKPYKKKILWQDAYNIYTWWL